jgi:hypothetical protein
MAETENDSVKSANATDKPKIGSPTKSLSSQHTKGTDQHPKVTATATATVGQHHTIERSSEDYEGSPTRCQDDDDASAVITETSFEQHEEIKCNTHQLWKEGS